MPCTKRSVWSEPNKNAEAGPLLGILADVYGVLAWPPEDLQNYMTDLRRTFGVLGYGPPHLNLRQPFQWPWGDESLKRGVEGILRGYVPFRVRLGTWRVFENTGVVYLRAYGGTAFKRLFRALEPLAKPEKEIEGPSYIPHLTLALAVDRAEHKRLLEALPTPPRRSFKLSEVVLVREREGNLRELATFMLTSE